MAALTVCFGEVPAQETHLRVSIIRGQRARVAFPASTTVDSTKLRDLLSFADSLAPLPGLRDAMPGFLTITLSPNTRPGAIAHAVASEQTVVLPLGSMEWSSEVLHHAVRHEIAHIGLFNALGGRAVPYWFSEGFAEWAAGGLDCRAEMRIRLALEMNRAAIEAHYRLAGPMPPQRTRLAYDLFATVIKYLDDEYGGIREILDRARAIGFVRALDEVTGLSVEQLENRWQVLLAKRYGSLPDSFSCRR